MIGRSRRTRTLERGRRVGADQELVNCQTIGGAVIPECSLGKPSINTSYESYILSTFHNFIVDWYEAELQLRCAY